MNFLKKILFPMLLVFTLAVGLTACDTTEPVAVESITISASDVTNVMPGNSVVLEKTVTPNDADVSNLQWQVVEGAEHCSISGDVLVVKTTAPTGAIIKVKATCGEKTSNELSFTVGYPITSVTVSSNAPAILKQGSTYPLSLALAPTQATAKTVEWVVSNTNYANVINNVLFVNEDVPLGSSLTVKAIVDGVESNELEYKVGVAISSIQISTSATSVKKGAMAILTAVTNQGATEGYEFVITQGDDYADVLNGTLVVESNAPTGTIIKVKAQSASKAVSSDEISITVLASDEEIRETTYYLVLSTDNITIDKNGTSTPTLSAKLYNLNGEQVTNKDIVYTLKSGSEDVIAIEEEANVCRFTQLKAHGTAYVVVTVDGEEISEEVSVNVILPPDAIDIPEVFTEDGRLNYAYNFSMKEPNSTELEKLPFKASIRATTSNPNPCEEIVYLFSHEDGSKGDEVATYVDGKITFNKTGKVTVTASSNSGSRVETTASYTFNINEGYNAYTFEEAGIILRQKEYNGQEVNFVALNEISGYHLEESDYNYGYSFVPQVALVSHAEQRGDVDKYDASKTPDENNVFYKTFNNTLTAANTRIFVTAGKSLHINGNKHKVDASNLYVPTQQEIDRYQAVYPNNEWEMHGGIISAEPWTKDEDDNPKGSYFARIYDVETIGNAPITLTSDAIGQGENKIIKGVYQSGINVGNIISNPNAKYYVDIKNVTSSACYDGIKITNAVGNSVLENIYVHNIYATGVTARASILTVKNLKLGACGATGIELQPEGSKEAGLDGNQNQQVTFEGTIDAVGNIHPTNTSYMNAYNDGASGKTFNVPTILSTSISINQLEENGTIHNVRNDKGELCVATFMLDYSVIGGESNGSQAIYAAYQQGGIIEATELKGTDTEHQFISLTIYAVQSVPLGRVLIYNLNYGKTA